MELIPLPFSHAGVDYVLPDVYRAYDEGDVIRLPNEGGYIVIIWNGDDPPNISKIEPYKELHDGVNVYDAQLAQFAPAE